MAGHGRTAFNQIDADGKLVTIGFKFKPIPHESMSELLI